MVAPAQHALVVSSTQILRLAEVEAAGLRLAQYDVQVATNVALPSLKSTAGASFDAVLLSLTGAVPATVEGFISEVC